MKKPSALLPFFLVCLYAGAQDRRQSGEAYLIPPIVYVGDRAALALPFAGGNAGKNSAVFLDPQNFPPSSDMDFHRITLERGHSGSRLLIEFSAFRSGVLELPPIEIGGERFAGLHVDIRSILDPGETGAVLSGPVLPLAVPGTAPLVYGTMGAVALLLSLSLWAGTWGRRHLGGWILRWRKRRLIVSMAIVEKRLRRTLLREGNRRDILNILSGEFRGFLAFFTGENCRAMTALEIGRLPPLEISAPRDGAAFPSDDMAEPPAAAYGGFLESFFRRCDELRFNGSEIITGDVLALLGDLRDFLEALYKTGRNKPRREEKAA